MTRERVGAKGEGMAFSDVAEVHRAYESRNIDLQAKVKVRLVEHVRDANGQLVQEHSSGRHHGGPGAVVRDPAARACPSMPSTRT